MASINGISVKGLKSFVGHEGEGCYQGNIYIANKKVGFWSQDSWGGPDLFNFDLSYSEKKLSDRVKELNPDKAIHGKSRDGKPYTIDYDLELLMYDLVKLLEDEKIFKNSIKKGFAGAMIVTDGYHLVAWNLKENLLKLSDENLLSHCSKMIEKAKDEAKFFKESADTKHEIKIYRSFSDFEIGTPIALKEICTKQTLDEKVLKSEKKSQKSSNNKKCEKER